MLQRLQVVGDEGMVSLKADHFKFKVDYPCQEYFSEVDAPLLSGEKSFFKAAADVAHQYFAELVCLKTNFLNSLLLSVLG